MRLAFASRVLVVSICGLISVLALSPRAAAQTYTTSTLLFPLTSPNGFILDGDPQQVAVGGQVAGSETTTIPNSGQHAVVWSPPSGTVTDMHPLAGYSISFAQDTNGTVQIGRVHNATTSFNRAMMWTGTAASATDLHPTILPGFQSSEGLGVGPGGLQQVGWGYLNVPNQQHALLWAGTAASAIDLHPTNLPGTWIESYALATNDSQQVGYGEHDFGSYHALMWFSASNTALDLHPTNIVGFDETQANGISSTGNHQVGYGDGTVTSGSVHALLWTSSAGSAVDLHPTLLTNFTDSYAMQCTDTIQVGKAFHTPDNAYHAMAWIGTADSAMDLHALLPITNAGHWSESEAYAIDANGNIWGLAHGTPDINQGSAWYSVEWSVPEPDVVGLICIGCIALLQRHRYRCTRRV